MLVVEKLYKAIDDRQIISDVSFAVPDGELVAITGSSGSGKTTLLKCVMGIYRPDSGSISLAVNEYSGLSGDEARAFRLQNIGVVDQQNRLIEDLTCLDNIRLIAAMSGQSKKESFESARGILARMGMEEYGGRFPYSLSGGERQRISIACALANNPSLIAADEPTSSLDDVAAGVVIKLFTELAEQYRIPVVLVTHDYRVKQYANSVYEIGNVAS